MPYGFNDDKSQYSLEDMLSDISSLQDELAAMKALKRTTLKASASGVTTTGEIGFVRIGNIVMATFSSNVNVTTANNPYRVGSTPVGFRPAERSQVYFGRGIVGNTINATAYRFLIGTSGDITYTASATGNLTAYMCLTYITNDAMPS